MISPTSGDVSLSLLEQAARFAERRQAVLSGNVANFNTPDYKTRDLPVEEFRKALSQVVAQSHAPPSLGTEPVSAESLPETLFDAQPVGRNHLTFQDGANRNPEQEVTEMTKNALQYRMAVEMLTSRMQLLQTVISGRL